MATIIEVENLTRIFDKKTVLKNLNLKINEGEHIALSGQNGSGKTTFLKILATLLAPTQGLISIKEYSTKNKFFAKNEIKKIKTLIGWVPAIEGGFVQRFTGMENLLFFGAFSKLGKKEIHDQLLKLQGLIPLQLALNTPFYKCSAGMRISLHIARAQLHDPEILILDEPTRSLDQESVLFLRDLLRKMKSKTIIFSTHLEDDKSMATRIIHLQEGELI